jgi:hypothetical protein
VAGFLCSSEISNGDSSASARNERPLKTFERMIEEFVRLEFYSDMLRNTNGLTSSTLAYQEAAVKKKSLILSSANSLRLAYTPSAFPRSSLT